MFVDTSSFQIILSFHCPTIAPPASISRRELSANECPLIEVPTISPSIGLSLKSSPPDVLQSLLPLVLFVPFLSPFWFLR